MEMKLHSRFAHIRRHGEWFEDQGDIRQYLQAIKGNHSDVSPLLIPAGGAAHA